MASVVTLRIQSQGNEGEKSLPSSSRHNRRAHVSPDVLRTFKLSAGDWVIVVPTTADVGKRIHIVAQLWPRIGLEDDAILISDSHHRNIGSVSTVDIYRFNPHTSLKGMLRRVTVREDQVVDKTSKPKSELSVVVHQAGHEREIEWLRAAIKESLTALRYVSSATRVTVENGQLPKTFVISHMELSTKPAKETKEVLDVVNQINGLSISTGNPDYEIYEIDWKTKIEFDDEKTGNTGSSTEKTTDGTLPKVTGTTLSKAGISNANTSIPSYINLFTPSQSSPSSYDQLGALDPQIKLIKSLLDLPLLHPELFTLFGLTPPKGILLHGPPGTGKTALARAIASSTPGCSCIVINGPELSSAYHGETEERLRGVFEEAKKRSPCIVVLDEVDALCPRRDGGEGGEVERRVVATLLTVLDGMGLGDHGEKERVFVIAATNRPNSIDPALRRPGRFDREIEIGIPDAIGRRQIIEIMIAKMPNSLTTSETAALAARTHGYVGADLSSLIRESASTAIQRWHQSSTSTSPSNPSTPVLTNADILQTLPQIRPSAMREVFVETPTVRWSDIAGQNDIKQKLKECVEWPLTHYETFKRLGVEAPRGVLLYGPPGCSKTMTAKALATESGINFIAVKGPELLNKYVGESEKAVREIFRKARAASPSIVFFDEIDALGSSRTEGGGSASNGVLTSLLNEMDGIEELSGVTVVAATNRPDVLDSALMRPGRLDRILYVGAPDYSTRRDIFRIRLGTMAVESGVDIDNLAKITEGCSGAEVASICQDAALATMNEDLEAPFVKISHLLHSAKTVRRRITPDMIRFFEEWRDQSGVRSA